MTPAAYALDSRLSSPYHRPAKDPAKKVWKTLKKSFLKRFLKPPEAFLNSAELIKKIKRIQIKTRRVSDAAMAGRYRSVFRGSGVEFEEVREYAPGDDVKSVDWKVTARMGRPYVKLYREERELSIMLAVDVSASGLFGTTGAGKRDMAVEMAAVLAFNAMRSNDKVGLLLFSDRVERCIPPKKGSGHVWRLIREMLGFEPEGRGTDVAGAAAFLAKVARKRNIVFFISDFLDAEYGSALRRLGRRHDVIAALLSDPGDFSLPEGGLLETVDLETGAVSLLDCSDRRTRRAYEQARRDEYASTREGFVRAGVDCVDLSTDASAADALRGFFRSRERRFR